MKTFYNFLKDFKEDDSPIGDLARDISVDRNHPKRYNSFVSLQRYLESLGACDSVLATFNQAWKLYEETF